MLGIEPARNVAAVARGAGIPTLVEFFGLETAARLRARGRDARISSSRTTFSPTSRSPKDFVAGCARSLKPGGVVTMEFPHLLRLIEKTSSTRSITSTSRTSRLSPSSNSSRGTGCELFDVEELPTHGGSLRIYAQRDDASIPVGPRLAELRERERVAGLDRVETYTGFDERVRRVKRDLLEFLIGAKRDGKSVVGYGAPAKGDDARSTTAGSVATSSTTLSTAARISRAASCRESHLPIRDPGRGRADEAGLPADPRVEPEGRDHRADGPRPRVRLPVRRPDPRDDWSTRRVWRNEGGIDVPSQRALTSFPHMDLMLLRVFQAQVEFQLRAGPIVLLRCAHGIPARAFVPGRIGVPGERESVPRMVSITRASCRRAASLSLCLGLRCLLFNPSRAGKGHRV